jgi:hypothetical protein
VFLRRVLHLAEPPEAEADAMEAPEERPVVDEPPRQDAVEVGAQSGGTDARTDHAVAHRLLRVALEREVAEMGMSVEARRGSSPAPGRLSRATP